MPVVAHSGGLGWDELLFLAVPVLVLALLGWQARKKADDDAEPGTRERGESTGGRSSPE